MHKILFFLIFCLTLFLPLFSSANSEKEISVVYCTNIAPFEYTDEAGKPNGLIIDFWKLWSKKSGIKVNFKKALWNDTLEMVARGEVDAHAGLFYNRERDTYLDYGTSLSKTTTHIFLHKSIAIPDTLEQLSAYRIGVIEKDTVEEYLKKELPESAITGYKDYHALTADLKSGKLKVFAADTATGLYYLSREKILCMFHFDNDHPLYTSEWYIASKEGNKIMLDMINAGMEQISSEERRQIERRWTSGTPSKMSDAVIIAISRDYPPFSMINAKGEASGYLIDLWQEWAALTDTTIEFRATNWSETLSGIKAGYADIHSGLFINPEIENWLDVSSPFIEVDTAIYFKYDSPIVSLEKMAGRKVGVIKKNYQESFLKKKYPDIHVITYIDAYDLLTALFQEQVQAVMAEVPEITGALQKLGLSNAAINSTIILSNQMRAGVLKNNKKMLDLINRGFAAMPEKRFSALKKLWFPDTESWQIYKKWIIIASLFITIVITVGLLWNYKLRNELVHRREIEQILKNAKEQAESANKAKSIFLANMSHEIRTPMNAILGMNQLALETTLSGRQKYLLKTVQTSSEHLLRLLDDILDFSKIEAGKLEILSQPFSLFKLLDTLFSAMNPYAQKRGLALETRIKDTGIPDVLEGDEFRIRQILYNLINNAIKFTEKGFIIVRVELAEEQPASADKTKILFSVSDTGIGILPEKQEMIFSSFQQADTSTARGFGGTGLGLTICRQLIHLLGGEIWLESTPGKGTTFFFTLLLDIGENKTADNMEKKAVNSIQNLKILLFEDNRINQDVAKMILEKDRHEVVIADNGLTGLKLLSRDIFDMAFMDIQMPEMDGLTACRIIRAVESGKSIAYGLSQELLPGLKKNLTGKHLPIVAMTANAMGGDRKKCLTAGMDDYITKPFQFETIRQTLAKLAQNSLISVREECFDKPLPQEEEKEKINPDIKHQAEEHLRKIYLLEDEQIDHILTTASKTLGDNLSNSQSAIKNRDYKQLGKIAHSIKGSLLNLGLNDLAKEAKRIEINAKENIKTDFQTSLARLDRALTGIVKKD